MDIYFSQSLVFLSILIFGFLLIFYPPPCLSLPSIGDHIMNHIQNILIKKWPEGRLVAIVADLGLAARIPDPLSEKPLAIVGSPYWMAPECIVGKTRYNEKADVFSYGIVLCEMIARVEADPDILPRTKKFGVDYVAFSKMAADCPLHLLHLAFICCQIEAKKRPSFAEVVLSLEAMKSSAQMAVILADFSRLGSDGARIILNRMILEEILQGEAPKKPRSEEESACATTSDATDLTPTAPARRHIIPVTPIIVGKVMSRDDAYYAPQKGNPFPPHFRDATAKVVGSILNCPDYLEMQSPRSVMTTPPETPLPPADSSWVPEYRRQRRRSHSLPGTPLFIDEPSFNIGADAVLGPAGRKTCSVTSSTHRLEDACSDDTESIDSALGLDMRSKNVSGVAEKSRFVRNAFRSSSLICPHSNIDVFARLFKGIIEKSNVAQHQSAEGSESFVKSYSSSGSRFSAEDSSAMSSASSFSSYGAGDVEAELPRAAAVQRLLSQERVQQLIRCWEEMCRTGSASSPSSLTAQSQNQLMLSQQLELQDFFLLRKFHELKRKWEDQQHTANST